MLWFSVPPGLPRLSEINVVNVRQGDDSDKVAQHYQSLIPKIVALFLPARSSFERDKERTLSPTFFQKARQRQMNFSEGCAKQFYRLALAIKT